MRYQYTLLQGFSISYIRIGFTRLLRLRFSVSTLRFELLAGGFGAFVVVL